MSADVDPEPQGQPAGDEPQEDLDEAVLEVAEDDAVGDGPHESELFESAGHRRRRRAVQAAAGVVFLMVLGVGGAAAFSALRGEVMPGTRVAGVNVGGMDEAEARRTVAGAVRGTVEKTVTLTVGTIGTEQVDPATIGIRLDVDATVDKLLDLGAGDLFSPVRALLGHRTDVEPVLDVDPQAGRAELTKQLAGYQRVAHEAELKTPKPKPLLLDKGTTSWTARDADVSYEPAEGGRSVDVGAAFSAVRAAVEKRSGTATVAVRETEPKVDDSQAERVDQLIGTFTTEHPCCQARVTNIHRMAELVDGTVVAPGAKFSLNQKVGRRTTQNGFVYAPAIADGEHVEQVGGGVSQFSTTLFNAVWFAGLRSDAHQPHSQYISRYPPGREATLDYDTIQNIFTNTTDTPVVIRTATTATSVTVALYGHTGERTVTSTTGPRIPRENGGFSIYVTRRIEDDGTVVGTERIGWGYQPTAP
ncbi:VanW family protein [Spongisporangium articulatum]|uniref:VanW family protein n=1 Tax=Spongisporangium articulatum TaxID=3362603 RepID=A0ABW8AT51_9ACTN